MRDCKHRYITFVYPQEQAHCVECKAKVPQFRADWSQSWHEQRSEVCAMATKAESPTAATFCGHELDWQISLPIPRDFVRRLGDLGSKAIEMAPPVASSLELPPYKVEALKAIWEYINKPTGTKENWSWAWAPHMGQRART